MGHRKPRCTGEWLVLFAIGERVMVPMVCGPPDRAALHGRCTQQGKQELGDARGLEGAMREVAVIEARNGEHAHEVERKGDGYGDAAGAHPEHGQASKMHAHDGSTRAHSIPSF